MTKGGGRPGPGCLQCCLSRDDSGGGEAAVSSHSPCCQLASQTSTEDVSRPRPGPARPLSLSQQPEK